MTDEERKLHADREFVEHAIDYYIQHQEELAREYPSIRAERHANADRARVTRARFVRGTVRVDAVAEGVLIREKAARMKEVTDAILASTSDQRIHDLLKKDP